jgi:hypothetical protein
MNPPQTKRWRILRRCLVGLAVCVTLIGLFYTEELWRGKRAWENCKSALEAKGADFKWADYIPAPVPENENVFGVPEMQQWFVGRGATEMSKKLVYPGFPDYHKSPRLVIAEVTIGLPGMPAPVGSVVLRWDDPASRTEAAGLLTNAAGSTAIVPLGIGLMLRRPQEIQAARIFLQCKTAPTEKELQRFLPDHVLGTIDGNFDTTPQFEPNGSGSYRVTMGASAIAADYLAWCETLDREFSLIRQALQRPYARIEGNFAEPPEIPIPNFVTVRSLTQTLGARAQCHFLLGRPEEALRDVTLMQDICRRVTEENKPMTLVSAMINAAMRGLYVGIIADGMRLQAWREPQLAALEEQLKQIHLLPPVKQAFEGHPAYLCQILETVPPTRLAKLFFNESTARKIYPWGISVNSILARLLPSGWLYQNLVTVVNIERNVTSFVDPTSQIVFPDKVAATFHETEAVLRHRTPYTFMAAYVFPNYSRAFQTTARNQTKVNQALIACALERYHLARGEYPETLDALAPQFIATIPHDVIGGQPPHYRRAADGTFILYSIGWNGRDNGGVRGKTDAEGDWVWPN